MPVDPETMTCPHGVLFHHGSHAYQTSCPACDRENDLLAAEIDRAIEAATIRA